MHGLLALLHLTILPRSCWIPILFSGRLAEHQTGVSQALIPFVLLTSILIRIFLCPCRANNALTCSKNNLKSSRRKKICEGLRAYITSLRAPVTLSDSGRSSGHPRAAKPKPSPSFSVLHPLRPAVRFHLSSERVCNTVASHWSSTFDCTHLLVSTFNSLRARIGAGR
jgi:hypothetical protein